MGDLPMLLESDGPCRVGFEIGAEFEGFGGNPSIVAHRGDGSEVSDRNGLDFSAKGHYVAVEYPHPEIIPVSTNTPLVATGA
ncbi:hypothetical protein [Streptomyces microflavus]|uniref:hypothetical protein n=1 Tax=Streptomyces microflavus TaxID=1919 RepID=UPI0036EBA29A